MEHRIERGDVRPKCGSCLWFDREADSRTGRCLYNPPIPHIVAVPTAIGGPPRAAVQGLRPPTAEGERCHHWEKHFSQPRTLLQGGRTIDIDSAPAASS